MKAMIARVLIWVYLVSMMTPVVAERAQNWNGTGDTTTISGCSGTTLVYSDSAYCMTDYNAVRMVLLANDTLKAGFSTDSINVHWGYQGFSLCYNSSGVVDTCYSPAVIVDTLTTATLGTMTRGTLDGNGKAYAMTKRSDTTSCTGYAVQSRAVFPEWNVNYRLWVQGMTGNAIRAPVKIKFVQVRQIYAPVRLK